MTPDERPSGSVANRRLSRVLSSSTKATRRTASSSMVARAAAIASSPRWPTHLPIVTYSRRATSSVVTWPMSAGSQVGDEVLRATRIERDGHVGQERRRELGGHINGRVGLEHPRQAG